MVRASDKSQGKGATSTQLLEVRRMIETGAAALAASRRTERDLQSLARHLRGMEDAAALNDVDAFVAADIAFHDVILRASGNILLPALYEPLGRLLSAGRRETSAVPEIQQNAIRMHREVTESLATGDPELSRAAMDRHMDQTSDDLREYVLHQR
jgi:DNA-binding FadR family transcriptional regulator